MEDISIYKNETLLPETEDGAPQTFIEVNNVELMLNKMLELFSEKNLNKLIFEAQNLLKTILETNDVEIMLKPSDVYKNR